MESAVNFHIDNKMKEEGMGFEKPKRTKKRRRDVTVKPLKLTTSNSFGILLQQEPKEEKREEA